MDRRLASAVRPSVVVPFILFCFLYSSNMLAQDAPDGGATVTAAQSSERASSERASKDAQNNAGNNSADSPVQGLQPLIASEPVSHQLTFDERVGLYRRSVFSPNTIIGPSLSAGIDQWQDDPTEWEQGMAGYGRRFGSSLGKNLLNKTIVFGVSAMDKEDPRYFRSETPGIKARSLHAVKAAFISYSEDGSRMPAYSRFAGAYGTAFIALTWYPDSKQSAQQALMQGTTKLAFNAGMNVLKEFWPDLKRRLRFGR